MADYAAREGVVTPVRKRILRDRLAAGCLVRAIKRTAPEPFAKVVGVVDGEFVLEHAKPRPSQGNTSLLLYRLECKPGNVVTWWPETAPERAKIMLMLPDGDLREITKAVAVSRFEGGA